MATTVLAVDDSVTLRKVLEITFGGPDFRVVTAASGDAALSKLKSDKPDVVVCDLVLDQQKSGYEVCKAIKQSAPGTPVILLSSKQTPFDEAQGKAAQADDHIDKPFDTQQLIDKVRKLVVGKGESAPAPQAAAKVGAYRAPARLDEPASPAPSPAARAKTLVYSPTMPAMSAARPTATPATGIPLPTRPDAAPPAATAATAAAASSAAVSGALNGQIQKLEGLGLTPAQVDAVLALSREVVERVVWEVVPVLAETLIKEEIARLTK